MREVRKSFKFVRWINYPGPDLAGERRYPYRWPPFRRGAKIALPPLWYWIVSLNLSTGVDNGIVTHFPERGISQQTSAEIEAMYGLPCRTLRFRRRFQKPRHPTI